MPIRPPVARIVLTVLFTVSGLNQMIQVPREFFGDEALPMLGLLQLTAGAPGLATAWGAWFATRWAWIAALAWGAGTATLILSLESLLQLAPEDAEGLVPAALVVAALAIAAAWYLWHVVRRRPKAATSGGDTPR